MRIYLGIEIAIIVLLNFLDKHVYLIPTCSGDLFPYLPRYYSGDEVEHFRLISDQEDT